MATDDEQRTQGESLRDIAGALTTLAQRPVFTLDAAATREALLDLDRLQCHLDAHRLTLAAHADEVGVAEETGATSTAAWWAVATRRTRQSTHRDTRTGQALEQRYHRVREALAGAGLNLDQAVVIVGALDDLTTNLTELEKTADITVDPALIDKAEAHLVDLAALHDPGELRILGARILSVIAPEIGEDHDRRALEKAEALARQKRRLHLSFDGHGAATGRFTLPEAQGRTLQKMLMAFAAPKHLNATKNSQTGEGWVKNKPTPAKLGEAFGELIESYPTEKAPRAGGLSATLLAITTLADLRSGLQGAVLDTGQHLTPGQTRRYACEAKIIPVVLGANSEILDFGQARRLFSAIQVIALRFRDRGCTAEGCDWPPGLCHAHHMNPWASGGHTDLNNARLLCPHHHTRIHDPAYTSEITPDNKIRFHRRP